MTTLNTYEYQVADLLHDPANANWSLTQLDNYINEARRKVVMDTGCLRSLQSGYITQGIEQYTFGQVGGAAVLTGGTGYTAPTIAFSGGGGTGVAATLGISGGAVNTITFTSFGSGYTSAPSYVISDSTGTGATLGVGIINVNTFDVLDIRVYWGTQRIPLAWKPFSVFSTMFRQWSPGSSQQRPVCWAAYGETSVFVGPVPDQTYAVEMDTVVLPTNYVVGDYTTVDPIPVLSQDPIKFYAAYLAKFNNQSYGEADKMLEQYKRTMRESTSSYTRRISDPYAAAQ